MRKLLLIIYSITIATICISQNLTGKWSGILFQEGKTDTFYYQLNIDQKEAKISGFSFSKNKDGAVAAKFEIVGTQKEEKITLQEINQVEPIGAKWCLKHIRLTLNNGVLEGNWEAEGCIPGTMRLTNSNFSNLENPPTPLGKWTGSISQTDRDYGFFYEIELFPNGTGKSYIVSEGNGGSAHHALNWKRSADILTFEETDITEKTSDEWRWCMKSAKLTILQNQNRKELVGDWWGYIEGYDQESGPCAPGQLYLEQPIIKREEKIEIPKFHEYVEDQSRPVNVGRVLEVKSQNIQIKVWDNGIVDGDVLSLFLNGKKLLENHRVSKRKYAMNIKLEKKTNYLILHAEDLGDITPNTVAVSVDDGVKEQRIILSSNLRESGAVMIRQFQID